MLNPPKVCYSSTQEGSSPCPKLWAWRWSQPFSWTPLSKGRGRGVPRGRVRTGSKGPATGTAPGRCRAQGPAGSGRWRSATRRSPTAGRWRTACRGCSWRAAMSRRPLRRAAPPPAARRAARSRGAWAGREGLGGHFSTTALLGGWFEVEEAGDSTLQSAYQLTWAKPTSFLRPWVLCFRLGNLVKIAHMSKRNLTAGA